jgi:SAM-dependent methyltransferase
VPGEHLHLASIEREPEERLGEHPPRRPGRLRPGPRPEEGRVLHGIEETDARQAAVGLRARAGVHWPASVRRCPAADISPIAVHRAGEEAARRGLRLGCFVADVRALPVRSAAFDVVLACDNALPHLLSEDEIRCAFQEFLRCLRRQGRCVISMRDYGIPPSPGTVETQDYGDRTWSERQCRLSQVRRWHGALYDVAFQLVTNDAAKEVVLRTPETTYFAIGIDRTTVLMEEAGFTRVRRIDGCLFQPVLIGARQV